MGTDAGGEGGDGGIDFGVGGGGAIDHGVEGGTGDEAGQAGVADAVEIFDTAEAADVEAGLMHEAEGFGV